MGVIFTDADFIEIQGYS